MSFKEQALRDLETVFLNTEEFAEMHRVEGSQIAVVMDNNRLENTKQGQILGLVEADVLIFGKETDFPKNLNPGRLLNVDGKEMLVVDSGKDMGMVEIALCQNRHG